MSGPRTILVVGAGVAGLTAALAGARAGAEVLLVMPGEDPLRSGGNTRLAQGGIAAALHAADRPSAHAADTIAAGAGLVDPGAAALLAEEGRSEVRRLIDAGLPVDRGPDGEVLLGLEGAHGLPRIVHLGGDRSGARLHDFLLSLLTEEVRRGRVRLLSGRIAERLLVEAGEVRGVAVRRAEADAGAGLREELRADAVVLATGGYAGALPRSTNAPGATGDGLLLAARAGALLADLEFVQFHPTVLHTTGVLVSEAVRGAGAVLRDGSGRRFMLGVHPLAELAPRDIVTRETRRVLAERGEEAVWLDATGIDCGPFGSGPVGSGSGLAERFPGIAAALAAHGYDWRREPIPVSPAAHYSMGGVVTDTAGRTSLPGLLAAGEVACTGVHGANRLASNSLLEGLVFGARAGRAAATGLGRSGGCRLAAAPGRFAEHMDVSLGGQSGSGEELRELIRAAAEARTESRGAHQRLDFPETDPAQAVRRSLRLLPLHAPAASDLAAPLASAAAVRSPRASAARFTTSTAFAGPALSAITGSPATRGVHATPVPKALKETRTC